MLIDSAFIDQGRWYETIDVAQLTRKLHKKLSNMNSLSSGEVKRNEVKNNVSIPINVAS